MIISVDFDGVIVTDAFPEIGEPLPGMLDAMRILADKGHTLIISTCRAGQYAQHAFDILRLWGIPFHYFNQNPPERTERYDLDCRKISADLYLDDKNLGGFPGWQAVLDWIPL